MTNIIEIANNKTDDRYKALLEEHLKSIEEEMQNTDMHCMITLGISKDGEFTYVNHVGNSTLEVIGLISLANTIITVSQE